MDDLISDEVEERTAELEKEVSHFKCSSARYRDIIKFLVRESKLDIPAKTAEALEEFRIAKKCDEANGCSTYTSYTNRKGYVYEQYEMIKKICNRAWQTSPIVLYYNHKEWEENTND